MHIFKRLSWRLSQSSRPLLSVPTFLLLPTIVHSADPPSPAEVATGLPGSVIAAVVAAVISAIVGVLTYTATLRGLKNQREMQERTREHSLSLKLIDLRLAAYPEAFEITDDLRSDFVFAPKLTQGQLQEILSRLFNWHKKKAGFILSSKSIRAWYGMRGALSLQPQSDGYYTEEMRRAIWEAKNAFRSALREDLELLYIEEAIPTEAQ